MRTRERGQAAVEFALVILFVIFLFLGMLEMIFLMYTYNALTGSAKEGVRYAIVHGSGNTTPSGPGTSDPKGNQVVLWVNRFTALSMQGQGISVNVQYPDGCPNPGCLVTVAITRPYRPFFGLGWPSVTINAAANGRIMN